MSPRENGSSVSGSAGAGSWLRARAFLSERKSAFCGAGGGAGVVGGGDHLAGQLRLLQVEDQRRALDRGRRGGREPGQIEPDRGIPDNEEKDVQQDGKQDDLPSGLASADWTLVRCFPAGA
ncbi:MAG: hypothetical protein MZV70_60200 [Desulfobacterales bacterium]|nr:hypothetical protein [Desulfobacterales bacterium]